MNPYESTRETLQDLEVHTDSVLEEVIEGLSRRQRHLPCKLFYDSVGSKLFDRICELPEYYLTGAEVSILQQRVAEIAARIGPGAALVEFGAGSCVKIRLLLDALEAPVAYVPIDVSRTHLKRSAREIAAAYPRLEVLAMGADFTRPLDLPELRGPARKKVIFFPGSTVGNFERAKAIEFLGNAATLVGPGGGVLIGVDLQKDPRVIEAAYNDTAGVTARFNANILAVINRELESNFRPARFEHQAVYDEGEGRIEMRLVSRCDQVVQVGGHAFGFACGEYIITEYSHKYTLNGFATMAKSGGLAVRDVWCDPERLFSVQYLEAI